jgi:hypothetical protein
MTRLIILSLFLLQSCTTFVGYNQEVTSSVDFKGGVHKDTKWDESMIFQRTSWYKGATMAYDILIHRLDRNSQFAKWLGESEMEYVNKCQSLLIVLLYTGDMQPTSEAMMKLEIEKNNYKEVNLLKFKQYLLNHQAYVTSQLFAHKFTAYCGQHVIGDSRIINMSIPGFKRVEVLN